MYTFKDILKEMGEAMIGVLFIGAISAVFIFLSSIVPAVGMAPVLFESKIVGGIPFFGSLLTGIGFGMYSVWLFFKEVLGAAWTSIASNIYDAKNDKNKNHSNNNYESRQDIPYSQSKFDHSFFKEDSSKSNSSTSSKSSSSKNTKPSSSKSTKYLGDDR